MLNENKSRLDDLIVIERIKKISIWAVLIIALSLLTYFSIKRAESLKYQLTEGVVITNLGSAKRAGTKCLVKLADNYDVFADCKWFDITSSKVTVLITQDKGGGNYYSVLDKSELILYSNKKMW